MSKGKSHALLVFVSLCVSGVFARIFGASTGAFKQCICSVAIAEGRQAYYRSGMVVKVD